MTLPFRKFPWKSSGKWRLVRMPLVAEGRLGRGQNSFKGACFPGKSGLVAISFQLSSPTSPHRSTAAGAIFASYYLS